MKDLLFFYGLECDHCKKMEKLVEEVIAEGIDIERVEVWNNKENEALMVSLDCGAEPCGGVPFFYNKKSGKSICGEATVAELEIWAQGK
jgi:hypothetical protein